jgi:hypothetical protein
MAKEDDNSIKGRPPDPYVAARISNPAEPAAASFQLSGLLGDSDRAGFRRLYLNTRLDYYVEFLTDDVLAVDSIGADTAPFVGLDATRVSLKRDAAVNYVHTRSGPMEAFDLDAQVGLPSGDLGGGFGTDPTDPTGGLPTQLTDTLQTYGPCVPRTLLEDCFRTVVTCFTCGNVCFTQQRTCFRTACATCITCETCGQTTCRTCNRLTCRTCEVQCWHTVIGATCVPRQCISQAIRCPTLACP